MRSFFQMMNVPLGFDATNVLTLRLPMAGDRFSNGDQLLAQVRTLVDKVRAEYRCARRRGDRRAAAGGLQQRHAISDRRPRCRRSREPPGVRIQDGPGRLLQRPRHSGDQGPCLYRSRREGVAAGRRHQSGDGQPLLARPGSDRPARAGAGDRARQAAARS